MNSTATFNWRLIATVAGAIALSAGAAASRACPGHEDEGSALLEEGDAAQVLELAPARLFEAELLPVAQVIINGEDGGVTSSSHAVFVEDGKRIEFAAENGEIIMVKVDGKVVPRDRLELDDNKLIIRDENGKKMFERKVDKSITSINPRPESAWRDRRMTVVAPGIEQQRIIELNRLRGDELRAARAAAAPANPPPVMLGVQMADVPEVLRGHLGLEKGTGILLSGVHEGLAASRAGLKPYDVIIGVKDKGDVDAQGFRDALRDAKAGENLTLDVIQGGQRRTVTLSPDAYDFEKLTSAKVAAIEQDNRFFTAMAPGAENVFTLPGPAMGELGPDARVFIERFGGAQGRGGVAPRAEQFQEMERLMQERMERMEKMLEEMMERQRAAPEEGKATETRS